MKLEPEPEQLAGWYRPTPRHRWRKIIAAADSAHALDLLLDAVAGGDKLVLPLGHDPNDDPRPR